MSKPYLLLSDLHFHNWSQFSHTTTAGTSRRLEIIIDEFHRACAELRKRGGNKVFMAGDLFHVRGKIEPSVLNPVRDAFYAEASDGLDIHVIPGNHDLEGRDSTRVSNAVTALEGEHVHVHHIPAMIQYSDDSAVLMVPWMSDLDKLRELGKCVDKNRPFTDLIIHAPVNGVITGLPDHGLDPKELANWGFRRVMAGHYHNNKEFPGNVWSIGATTHQTWGDVGHKAGFLFPYADRVEFQASHAPSFVDLDPDIDPVAFKHAVDGNYVRVKIGEATEQEIRDIRLAVMDEGALGCIVNAVVAPKSAPTAGRVNTKGVTLEQSIAEFAQQKVPTDLQARVTATSVSILNESRSAA